MADVQSTERDFDQADQRTDSRFEEQQRETVRQGQQLIAIEKLIAQNDKHHKDHMARYEANQEKMFEQMEVRIDQNDKYHKDRMSRLSEIQRELRATMQSNFNWIIGVVLGGVFLILGTLVTGFFALPK